MILAGLLAAAATPPLAAKASRPGAESLIRTEWSKAANRRECAPLQFTAPPSPRGIPRRALFSGGWAVAFDTPQLRSAYGLAGPGLLDEDRRPLSERQARIAAQWPHGRELGSGGFAGYGLEGAKNYAPDNPNGVGESSLAYVVVPGQTCTYNIWSKLGRRHLEALLDGLRPLPRR